MCRWVVESITFLEMGQTQAKDLTQRRAIGRPNVQQWTGIRLMMMMKNNKFKDLISNKVPLICDIFIENKILLLLIPKLTSLTLDISLHSAGLFPSVTFIFNIHVPAFYKNNYGSNQFECISTKNKFFF